MNKITAVIVKETVKGDIAIVLNEETAKAVTDLLVSAEQAPEITDEKTFKDTDMLCGRLRATEKDIEENREALTRPLEAFKKSIIKAAKDVTELLKKERDRLGDRITAYTAEQKRIAAEAQRKADEERIKAEEAEKKRLAAIAKAAEANDFPPEETLEPTPMPVQPAYVAPVIKSRFVKAVPHQVLRIYNPALIPRSYLVPDEVKIRKDLLDGIKIKGCEMVEETRSQAK